MKTAIVFRLFKLWQWTGAKVFGMPFILEFQPGTHILGVVISASAEFVQRIQDNFDIQPKYEALQRDHKAALDQIVELEEQLTKNGKSK